MVRAPFFHIRSGAALLALTLLVVGDVIPPELVVVHIQPFISHMLVTVEMNEDGRAYCGVVLDTGGGSTTPSAAQLKSGDGLASSGASDVLAQTHTHVLIPLLSPDTSYDVYCYAEDEFLNGISWFAIAATMHGSIVTAAGGDNVAPTLAYTPPYEVRESTALTVYVQMSEDGTVWCVARRDYGSGTTVPTSGEIRLNVNVDAWAMESITPENLYVAGLRLVGLLEDTTYDIYCFGEDVVGNGIDGSPAFVPDPNAIASTKRSSLKTLATLTGTLFSVVTAAGLTVYNVEPATWNLYLPRGPSPGLRYPSVGEDHRDLESWSAPLDLHGSMLVNHIGDARRGCGKLPAVPRGLSWVALLRRGACQFSEKAVRARRAGYHGVVVVDYRPGAPAPLLPAMTAGGDDEAVGVPAWIIDKASGEAIAQAVTDSADALLTVNIVDHRRKPTLGNLQSDAFGFRIYATH